MLPILPLKRCLWKCVPAFCDDSCFTMVQYAQYSLCVPWTNPTTSSLGGEAPSQMLCWLGFDVYGSLHSPKRAALAEALQARNANSYPEYPYILVIPRQSGLM